MSYFADWLTDSDDIPSSDIQLLLTSIHQMRVSVKAFRVHSITFSTITNVSNFH